MKSLLMTVLCVAALATVSSADQFIETFDGGSNVGGWSYFAPVEFIADSGGNPGAYLRADGLDTYAPQPRTTQESVFSGDFQAMNVQGIGVDLATFHVDFSAEDRPCSLMLYSDAGTPGDMDDDWAAFQLGPDIPVPGDGWQSYDFAVPSQETSWPLGWSSLQFGPTAPEPDWAALMADVDAVGFFYGNPENFFIFQMWQIGLDNPRLTFGSVATESATWGGVKSMFR